MGFAAIVTVVMVISAGLNTWLGARGTLLAAAVTGIVDPHATAASIASLVAVNKMSIDNGMWAILAGLTTNAVMKAVVAFSAEGGSICGTDYTWAGAGGSRRLARCMARLNPTTINLNCGMDQSGMHFKMLKFIRADLMPKPTQDKRLVTGRLI